MLKYSHPILKLMWRKPETYFNQAKNTGCSCWGPWHVYCLCSSLFHGSSFVPFECSSPPTPTVPFGNWFMLVEFKKEEYMETGQPREYWFCIAVLLLVTFRRAFLPFPMHFSEWGANMPAAIDLPQFMQSNISLATEGWLYPNMSTTYLLFVSPLLLGSAKLTHACADKLTSSSSSSDLGSRPNFAIRWDSDATSTIIESRRSPKVSNESCKDDPSKLSWTIIKHPQSSNWTQGIEKSTFHKSCSSPEYSLHLVQTWMTYKR